MKRLDIKKTEPGKVSITISTWELVGIRKALTFYGEAIRHTNGNEETAEYYGQIGDEISDFIREIK